MQIFIDSFIAELFNSVQYFYFVESLVLLSLGEYDSLCFDET